jgi:UDP-glucuronate 4-epimerase
MKVVVTGAAGFIGGHLCRALLDEGHRVVGLDSLTDYYDVAVKRAVLASLGEHEDFSVQEDDLNRVELPDLLDGVDVVFHLAAQPGVRLSWSAHFETYVKNNVLASQRLLEAVRDRPATRIVAASSASVYGNATTYPTDEHAPTRPFSPYGVTKLAMEQLFAAYAENFDVDSILLRYFSVYGPGQRPDMGLHRFIESALTESQISIFGDGSQRRDFTYVDDIVRATIAAATTSLPSASVLNIAGNSPASVSEVLELISSSTGAELNVKYLPAQPGDVQVTGGAIERALEALPWQPEVPLSEGIRRQVLAQRESRRTSLPANQP